MAKMIKVTTAAVDKLQAKLDQLHDAWAGPARDERMAAVRAELIPARGALAAPVEAALAGVNGRATAHAITAHSEVKKIADDAEALLAARGVTKANRIGATVTHRPAGPSASAYKYAATTTVVTLVRVSDGWRMQDVQRAEVHPKQPAQFDITVSRAAAEDIMRAAMDGIRVREEADDMAA